MIHRITSGTAVELWPLVQEHAAAAMEHHPFMDAADLLDQITTGHAQLFIVTAERAFVGFATMEVLQYPRCRVANVLAAGGNRGFLSVAVKDLFPMLEAWAREQGADTFAVHGRPGWLRVSKAIEGSNRRTYGVAWRRLDHERRRQPKSDDAGIGALERGATLSS
jgi:hypothetical protein